MSGADRLPGVPELNALLAGFGGAYPDATLVVQAGDLAYPVVCEMAGRVARRLGRSITVALVNDRGTSWRLLVDGEEMTSGTVQPFGDDLQPE